MQTQIRIRQLEKYDVCVIGGGPAGFCAAMAAARNGAKTALIERYGMLGGTMTVGGIPAPALFHAHGKQIIAGIGWELMVHLADHGYARLPEPPFLGKHPAMAVKVNAFGAAKAMNDFCKAAKVSVMFHEPVVETIMQDGRIDAVLIATKGGVAAVKADVYADCSGDGDVAAFAGVPFDIGSTLQPGSFNVVFEGFDSGKIDRAAADAAFEKAVNEGLLQLEDVWSGRGKSCRSLWDGRGSNLNHVYPLNGADSKSRSDAEVRARESVERLLYWMRKEVPGCEHAYVSATAPETWVRESRRIKGMKTITGDEYISGYVPDDAVSYSFYPIDVHTNEKEALINQFHEEGKVPGIPYGALVPAEGCSNLLVAGKCISGDRMAQSAYRVQASCMAMGQAAGTAAALAVKEQLSVRSIDIPHLKQLLSDQGAIVP